MNLPDLYSATAEALGWALLHSLWQGLLLFFVIYSLMRMLRDHSPQARYLLLCSGVIMLLGIMIATFIYYFDLPLTVLPEPYINFSEVSVAAAPWQEATGQTTSVWQAVIWDRISTFMQVYAGHLVTVWLLGAFIFALRWTGSFYLTNRLRASSHLVTPSWARKLNTLAGQIGLRRPVLLRESPHIDVPMVLGHFKPIILLPAGSMIGLSPQQLEAVLLHELAHVHRNDYLTNLMLSCLEILLFYHPLYWWLTDRIMQEREQCCDDMAVAICGNARLYAKTLLLMEEKRQQTTLAMAYQGKKHHLFDRIKRICLTPARPYRREMGRAGFALLLLLGVAVIAWAQLPAQDAPPEIETTTQVTPHTAPAPATEARIPAQPQPSAHTVVTAEAEPHPGSSPEAAVPNAHIDTLPRPAIPAMQEAPALPELPSFSFDVSADKLKDESSRAEMRKQIENYEKALENWKKQVDEQHMSHWRARQDQLRQLFENWQNDLKRKHAGDDLQYAVALNKGSEYFEDAFEELEDAVEESEDQIEDRAEDHIEELEDKIEDLEDDMEDEEEEAATQEERMAKHRERMAFHRDRMSMHRLRMGVHRARMDIHRQRMDMHRDRMDIHRKKMDAHRVIMESFNEAFFAQLEKDGLYSKDEDKLDFVIKDGKITVNGKELTEQQARPYLELLKKHGMEIPTGDSEWRYRMDGGSKTIGTMHRSHK